MEKLTEILKDLEQGKISADNAEAKVLRLFGVVGQSEQLKCDCGETENIKKIAICACCYNPHTGEW